VHRTHLEYNFISKSWAFVFRETFQEAFTNSIKQTLFALNSTNSRDSLLFPVAGIWVVSVNIARRIDPKIGDELGKLSKLE
jgi:hypothetical protein